MNIVEICEGKMNFPLILRDQVPIFDRSQAKSRIIKTIDIIWMSDNGYIISFPFQTPFFFKYLQNCELKS